MRRHQASNVLGGAYVLPGGKLDLEDQNPAWLQRLSQDSATLHQRLNEPEIPGERAAGLFVAAMREAYEECRVLLGCAPHAQTQAQALLQALRSGQSWHEAFAAQALTVTKVLGFDPAKVNINGGAIALGHPVGATGAVIATKCIHELHRSGGRYGLATMCIGGGQGIAVVFERL